MNLSYESTVGLDDDADLRAINRGEFAQNGSGRTRNGMTQIRDSETATALSILKVFTVRIMPPI